MIHTEHDLRAWKTDQISYFKRYLSNFHEGSEEFHIIQNGISELEKTM